MPDRLREAVGLYKGSPGIAHSFSEELIHRGKRKQCLKADRAGVCGEIEHILLCK